MNERESFERHLRVIYPQWSFASDGCGGYHANYTEAAWMAWQSARGPAATTTSEGAERIGYIQCPQCKGDGCELCLGAGTVSVEVALTHAYAEGRRDEQQELSSVLPGTAYMDLPDGGAPTILEQLQRQAKDAARYCWLRRFDHFATVDAMLDTTGYNTLDAAVDAAMSRESSSSNAGVRSPDGRQP